MGREVGGGIGMGKTCEPKAFSFQCMTKFTTNKKRKKKKNNSETENSLLVVRSVKLKNIHNFKVESRVYLVETF